MGFDEADALKSSSILIYLTSKQRICTQNGWQKAMSIKKGNGGIFSKDLFKFVIIQISNGLSVFGFD